MPQNNSETYRAPKQLIAGEWRAGGLKDSGYGQEGGPEGLQAYMHSKYVNHA